MPTDANKTLVRRLFDEGFSKNDPGVLREVLAEDFTLTSSGAIASDGEVRHGTRETLIAGMAHNHRAFSGWQFTLDHILAEDDHVAVRWTGRGRHVGSFMGEAPTGATVELHGNSLYRIAGGKIVQDWVFADQTSFGRALGIGVPPDPAVGERLVRAFWNDVINKHDPAAADHIMSPDYRQHAEGIAQGPEGLKAFLSRVLAQSRGMRATVGSIASAGDIVVSRTTVSFDTAPPGWAASQEIVDIFRTDGQRLTEHWDFR
jgi:predicted SnoaL-like aldol condensation-catalyzing enzyme/predicted ester cyclase